MFDQILITGIFLSVTAFSAFSILKTGNIYDDSEIKSCKDLWFSVLLSGFIYGICAIYLFCYVLWQLFCRIVCSQNNSNIGFSCLRTLFLLGCLGVWGWETYIFIRQRDDCYQNYEKNYNFIWICFYVQVLSIMTVIPVIIIATIVRNKRYEGYNLINE